MLLSDHIMISTSMPEAQSHAYHSYYVNRKIHSTLIPRPRHREKETSRNSFSSGLLHWRRMPYFSYRWFTTALAVCTVLVQCHTYESAPWLIERPQVSPANALCRTCITAQCEYAIPRTRHLPDISSAMSPMF